MFTAVIEEYVYEFSKAGAFGILSVIMPSQDGCIFLKYYSQCSF